MRYKARMVRTVVATRYVTLLREGGSAPAIVEADDDGMYVLKFRGAGQGPRALVAELVAGEIGRGLGLPVPEIVLIELDPALGATERDPEIKDLIEASAGLNIGIDYLPGSLAFDPALRPAMSAEFASRALWFDAFILNVDRTARNTNILLWHHEPWLIDHGASLYFHHRWPSARETARSRFPQVREHVLLGRTDPAAIVEADSEMRARLAGLVERCVALTPESWLGSAEFAGPEDERAAYVEMLELRLREAQFVEEALDARRSL